ncbi:hypothetical protein [Nocardioides sp. YIM 152315]|uniref:hypothetical protein n=1 Tax=Nocardioides sp. YIM 152315 TaxID=3031760 RepID=UPI0023DC4C58|nr:hypothetical protein [Nocardioides sp. YIM 152315]MDF1603921.1 hypothetical protein [Nocardioides sp. YIM 152315]
MILPMHLGALHPFEQALTLILAFGPFVVLGAVIVHRRRHDAAEAASAASAEAASTEADPQRDR